MNKIILLYLMLASSSVSAIGWDQKAFDQSMKDLKKSALDVMTNPKTAVDGVKNKWNTSLSVVKEGLKRGEQLTDNKKILYYYDYVSGRVVSYSHVNTPDQFFVMLSSDFQNTANYVSQNSQSIPIVGPYIQQIQKNFDFLKAQNIPQRLYIFKN